MVECVNAVCVHKYIIASGHIYKMEFQQIIVQERSMSMPTRPASQAGNPIKGGEDNDSFGSDSPRLEVILPKTIQIYLQIGKTYNISKTAQV